MKAIHRKWIREGLGIQKKAWFNDNGGEFKNYEMEESLGNQRIKIEFSPGYSSRSNGTNERNHYREDVILRNT